MLDIHRRELRHGSELVPVEPQVFDLLVYLIHNRDRVVSKDDLIAAVWGGRIVSDSTLTSRINAARKAVGDTGGEQRLIRTVARKGIRFVAEVSEGLQEPSTIRTFDASAPGRGPDATTATDDSGSDRQEPFASRRASIAVMPFVDQSKVASVRGGAADALPMISLPGSQSSGACSLSRRVPCLRFASGAWAQKKQAGCSGSITPRAGQCGAPASGCWSKSSWWRPGLHGSSGRSALTEPWMMHSDSEGDRR